MEVRMLLSVTVFLMTSTDGLSNSKSDNNDDGFEFTRSEPGNELGITTKVIAHIHRPAKKLTETWRLNREFTPEQVMKTLYAMCSDELIDRKIKWNNCDISKEGLTAELTHGVPESKNKTITYLAMTYAPFSRNVDGKEQLCTLAMVEENPSYFMLETFSKVPSNDSFPRTPQGSVDTVHLHRLGKFGKEFLSIYGNSIDQDGIYNFDSEDFIERDQLYECFLSIGSSESATVIEQKCPVYCLERTTANEFEDIDLPPDARKGKYNVWKNVGFKSHHVFKKKLDQEDDYDDYAHSHQEL